MADEPRRCVFADDCPQRRLKERRMVESMEKYRKETTEQFDLCDGTCLNSVTVLEGQRLNGGDWDFKQTQEKFRTEQEKEDSPKNVPCEMQLNSSGRVVSKESLLVPSKDILPCSFRKESDSPGDSPYFPICEYRPPRPSSRSTHVSERTISLHDSSRHSSVVRKNSSPIPAPRRISSVERSSLKDVSLIQKEGNTTSMCRSPTRFSVQETPRFFSSPTPTPRRSIASAPPTDGISRIQISGYATEEQEKSMIIGREELGTDKTSDSSNKSLSRHSTRTSIRTSSRSAESRFFRVHSVTGSLKGRPHVFRETMPLRRSPEPIGENYGTKQKEIPVYREPREKSPSIHPRDSFNSPSYHRTPERPQIREETVTKETFERVTTTRKLWPGTYV